MLALKLLRRRAAPAEQGPVLQRAEAMPLEAPLLEREGVEAALLAGEPFVRTFETLRFADTDLNGHITHPVTVALFQNSRAQLLATP